MRYVIEETSNDPDALVEVVAPDGGVTTLLPEHVGASAFIGELRGLFAAYAEEVFETHQVGRGGVAVPPNERKSHLGRMLHGELLAYAARAIEMELFEIDGQRVAAP